MPGAVSCRSSYRKQEVYLVILSVFYNAPVSACGGHAGAFCFQAVNIPCYALRLNMALSVSFRPPVFPALFIYALYTLTFAILAVFRNRHTLISLNAKKPFIAVSVRLWLVRINGTLFYRVLFMPFMPF